MADYYYVDRAGIFGEFVKLQAAKRLFAEHDCKGDLESGFAYWASQAALDLVPERIVYLVSVRVSPVDLARVPPWAVARLDSEPVASA